jgi:hypothetical protein
MHPCQNNRGSDEINRRIFCKMSYDYERTYQKDDFKDKELRITTIEINPDHLKTKYL